MVRVCGVSVCMCKSRPESMRGGTGEAWGIKGLDDKEVGTLWSKGLRGEVGCEVERRRQQGES